MNKEVKSFMLYKTIFDMLKEFDRTIQHEFFATIETEVFVAVCRLVFENEEPELNGLSKRIFDSIRPQFDKIVERNRKNKKNKKIKKGSENNEQRS